MSCDVNLPLASLQAAHCVFPLSSAQRWHVCSLISEHKFGPNLSIFIVNHCCRVSKVFTDFHVNLPKVRRSMRQNYQVCILAMHLSRATSYALCWCSGEADNSLDTSFRFANILANLNHLNSSLQTLEKICVSFFEQYMYAIPLSQPLYQVSLYWLCVILTKNFTECDVLLVLSHGHVDTSG